MKPEPIYRLERRIVTKRIEIAALEADVDIESEAGYVSGEDEDSKLTALREEVDALEREKAKLTKRWEAEKAELEKGKIAKERLDEARKELEKAQREGDFARAGMLMHGVIPELEKEMAEPGSSPGSAEDAERAMGNDVGTDPRGVIIDVDEEGAEEDPTHIDDDEYSTVSLLSNAVTPRHIAEVVASATGIPQTSLLESGGRQERLLQMETDLEKRVVGQDRAVKAISDSVRLSQAGLRSHDRPIGVFLFLGPTGVGKTELTKVSMDMFFT